jgi:hypothetical protein
MLGLQLLIETSLDVNPMLGCCALNLGYFRYTVAILLCQFFNSYDEGHYVSGRQWRRRWLPRFK